MEGAVKLRLEEPVKSVPSRRVDWKPSKRTRRPPATGNESPRPDATVKSRNGIRSTGRNVISVIALVRRMMDVGFVAVFLDLDFTILDGNWLGDDVADDPLRGPKIRYGVRIFMQACRNAGLEMHMLSRNSDCVAAARAIENTIGVDFESETYAVDEDVTKVRYIERIMGKRRGLSLLLDDQSVRNFARNVSGIWDPTRGAGKTKSVYCVQLDRDREDASISFLRDVRRVVESRARIRPWSRPRSGTLATGGAAALAGAAAGAVALALLVAAVALGGAPP